MGPDKLLELEIMASRTNDRKAARFGLERECMNIVFFVFFKETQFINLSINTTTAAEAKIVGRSHIDKFKTPPTLVSFRFAHTGPPARPLTHAEMYNSI